MANPNAKHTLLIANRGEIAVRIIRTAKKMSIRTVSVYTPADAIAPHVTMADISVALPLPSSSSSTGDASASATEGAAYLNHKSLIDICTANNVTLVHPGYGFLSENAKFAEMVVDAGITWIGPSPAVMRAMGMKHEARNIVQNATSDAASNGGRDSGLRVVPGSEGLVKDANNAEEVVERVGLPVIFKPSAGGGGLGMIICERMEDVRGSFENAMARAKSFFGDGGVFVEKYIPRARHVEIQVFGDGGGKVVHMGERECSTQRRHQKVVEECPSPFLEAHPGLREKICDAAVSLCRSIKYGSAGTVEFVVDDETSAFYFLEMNTRIQVEHPITEVVHNNLDLIEMMLDHGIAIREGRTCPVDMNQATYDALKDIAKGAGRGYAIEGRVYAENPAEGFLPSPGLLQHVQLEEKYQWLRIDSWVSTGIQITPHFDPLLCKIIVHGSTREETISRFVQALEECKIYGPPHNMEYLKAIADSSLFREGKVTTKYLDIFSYTPNAVKVIEPGLEATVQDLPGRTIGKGIPHSGPMDPVAFSIGNILVGNERNTEGIELIIVPGVMARLQFFCSAVVAVTGRDVVVKVDDKEVSMWSRIVVPAEGIVAIEAKTQGEAESGGLRTYLSIRGGFPTVPKYLASKSTSMGLGGYQGRSLITGDFITLGNSQSTSDDESPCILPREMIPVYPRDWTIYVLPGPHDDEGFLTPDGILSFYSTRWQISPSSNRMGIRLESPQKIQWARTSGGEGGAHPSNILDNAYAFGAVNINGDTPVLLTNEGPDMGGYICLCAVATGELWKMGQLSPGGSVQFQRVSHKTALNIKDHNLTYLSNIEKFVLGERTNTQARLYEHSHQDEAYSPRLHQKPEPRSEIDQFSLRQAGDSAILAEFGIMELDFFVRAKIQVFLKNIESMKIRGIKNLSPCIRSLMIYYDNNATSQTELLQHLIAIEHSIPDDLTDLAFPGRKITFPIVLDDPWNKDATERYMRSIREKAVYLPSNIEYLANNNGLSGPAEALQKLVSSDWIIFGVGFYLACPFLVPIDPLSRLTGQKLNPSRTFTPRGAIGIAGPVAAIYPIDSPGGYQLFGRSLPAWQTWGKGKDFRPDSPWLLEPFDQLHFESVDIESYNKIEKLFDQGRYVFKIEPTVFSMKDYARSLLAIETEIAEFQKRQRVASEEQGQRERELLLEWEQDKTNRKFHPQFDNAGGPDVNAISIKATLFASVWKISCDVGDIVTSTETPLVVLEAMKSEIAIRPSSEHVGKAIKAFGPGIKEGALVKPGDALILL